MREKKLFILKDIKKLLQDKVYGEVEIDENLFMEKYILCIFNKTENLIWNIDITNHVDTIVHESLQHPENAIDLVYLEVDQILFAYKTFILGRYLV